LRNPAELLEPGRIVELLKSMVAIPSVTNHEHHLGDWVYGQLQSIGLTSVHRLPVEDSGDTIVGEIQGVRPGPGLLLNFHLDTFPVCEGWHTDPFTPHIAEGRLYGLGAHDMKGGAACLLAAVEAILASGWEPSGRLVVAATSDEENWSRGAHALIQSGILDGCRYCLIPEPSLPATIAVGARGRHVFHLILRGEAGHAAYGEGVNAVLDAARVALGLQAVELGCVEADRPLGWPGDWEPPGLGMSGSLCVIGMHGGGTLILVPEEAHLYIDRHILPGQTLQQAAAEIQQVIVQAGIASTWQLTWDERPTPAPAPYLLPADSPLVQTVRRNLERESGQPVRLVLSRSVADTNHFAVHGGIPTVVCGPQGGNTCRANEYVETFSLLPIARTYVHTAIDLLENRS
jgi:acetylornithine deacetylase/succinyl-diaminopimelate desuccinylase-like protein